MFVLNPKLVILDEPTASLDQRGVEKLRKIIQKLNGQKQTTFIIISHDASFLRSLSHGIFEMKSGLSSRTSTVGLKILENLIYK